MNALDQLTSGTTENACKQNATVALRQLATNRDLRIFLTALVKYSKSDWGKTVRACQILYSVLQSSIMITADSPLLDEISKVPHIAAFLRRISEE